MVEKANACGHARFSSTVEIQLQTDVGFVCLSDFGYSRNQFFQPDPALEVVVSSGFRWRCGTGEHVAAPIARSDAPAFEFCEKSRTCGTEISEKKISSAGKRGDADFLEFSCEPGAETFYGAHVSAHSASVRNGGFGGDERGQIDREGRHGAAEKRDGVGLRQYRAEAKAGERGGF